MMYRKQPLPRESALLFTTILVMREGGNQEGFPNVESLRSSLIRVV